jgi:hypothetical protein
MTRAAAALNEAVERILTTRVHGVLAIRIP